MLITRKCILTFKTNTLDIDITQSQLNRINQRHTTGEYIQNIVPNLSSSEREFLMTGILDETWQERLAPLDEELFQESSSSN